MRHFFRNIAELSKESLTQSETAQVHLEFLDGLRGVAILSVFFFHALGASFGFDQLKWNGLLRDFGAATSFLFVLPFSFGSLGVAVFFVISGFCIHLSHARSKDPGFKVFYIRRFFRIYPPYFIAVCLFVFVYQWHKTDLRSFGGIVQLSSHIAMVHNLDARTIFGINDSFWSIAVEVQLYALYPLLWHYARKTSWTWALWVCGGIEFGVRATLTVVNLPTWIEWSPFAFWFSWCIGASIADSYLMHRLPRIAASHLILLAAITVLANFFKPTAAFMFPLTAVFTGGILCQFLANTGGHAGSPKNNPVKRCLSAIGIVSYSFYLLHQPIVFLVPRALKYFLPNFHPMLCLSLCFLLISPIYFLSVQFYRWIELPSIAAGKWLVQKTRSTTPTPKA